MIDEPVPNTEYTLIRTVESGLHVVTYVRYVDDSGYIRHGEYNERWEFNWQGLLDAWRALHDVGWIVEESQPKVDVHQTDRRVCSCKWFNYDNLFELQAAGLPPDEIERRWRDHCHPISRFHDRILWGN